MKQILQYVLILAIFAGWSTAVHGQSGSSTIKVSDTAGCSPLKVKFSSNYTSVKSYKWDFGNGNTSILAKPENVYTESGYYHIKLTVTFSNDEIDETEFTNAVHVVSQPKPAFTVPNIQLCPNTALQFINNSTDAVGYIWDFGDGQTSASVNPIHTYIKPGAYTVKLLATNKYNCSVVKEIKNAVVIQELPTPDFTVTDSNSCIPGFIFKFKYSGTAAKKYLWDFGDSITSTLANPSHAYKTPGKYDIKLTVYNATGCVNTIIRKGFINQEEQMIPIFTASGNDACVGSNVRFKDSTTGASKWFWDFGDGKTSTSKTPTHTYRAKGVYTVKLTVQNASGCSESNEIKDLVKVSGEMTVAFEGQKAGCIPLEVTFKNNSSNNVDRYLWNFGDGTISTEQNPKHTYTKSGTFTVKLYGYGKNNCEKLFAINKAIEVFPKPTADFSASDTLACPPFKMTVSNNSKYAASYLWDFGDGITSTDSIPTHTYIKEGTYSIRLIATNAGGCADTFIKKNYIVVKAPVTKFRKSNEINGCTPYSTRFSDATPGNIAWSWNFGDGTTSALQNPEHTWTKAGKYSVTLTTMNTNGCEEIIKNFQKYNLAPYIGSFTFKKSDCPPYKLEFKDSSTDAIRWIWNFGDGVTSNEQNPTHTYNRSGDYEVHLTVINASGCNYTSTQTVHFESYGADFTIRPLSITSTTVQFYAKVSNYKSLKWDFGDGTTSTATDPLHTYTKRDENIVVTLTVITKNNCNIKSNKIVFPIVLSGSAPPKKPSADFSPSVQGGCAPLSLIFYNKSANYTRSVWDFGDGTTSTEESPSHIFTTPGNYKVKLSVYNIYGSSSTVTNIVKATTVNPEMHVEQITTADSVSFYFEDRTAGAELRIWDFGDGVTSTDESPTHRYSNSADGVYYNVKLTVIDSFGCMGTTVKAVRNSLNSIFSISAGKGCIGVDLTFTPRMKQFKKYEWHFGDGTTSKEMRPKHAYKVAKKYMPSLTVTDDADNNFTYYNKDSIIISEAKALFTIVGQPKGCDSVTVTFDNLSDKSSGYLWDFGDGTTSTKAFPTHTYAKEGVFTPTLTAYNEGCSDVYKLKNSVNVLKAHPEIGIKQLNGCFPITIQFTDKTKNSASRHWDFGDGNASDERNPIHTFYEMPKGKTKLSIVTSDGCEGETSKPSIVTLKSDFSIRSKKGCVPFTVNFGNNSIMAKSWYWDFGDGHTSTEKTPIHTYTEEGIFTVKLVANAEEGCTDTITKSKLITAVLLKAGFSSPITAECAPTVIHFTDESHGAGKWFWDFGDGSTSDIQSPVHIYNHPGYYTIKQAVSNTLGCTDTLIREKYIHILGPISNFTLSEKEGCPPLRVNFTDKSQNAVSWQWNFGDGYTSTDREPVHFYVTPGKYGVTLITFDSTGCQSVYVYPSKVIVKDTTSPENTVINRVSVQSNTEVTIEWKRSEASNYYSYILWRKNNLTGVYDQIASINDQNTVSYLDNGLNTLANTYTYKLQVQNECGHAVQLSECLPHTTINITAAPQGYNVRVSWTPYKGSDVTTYTLYRQEPNTVPIAVVTVAADQLDYTDTSVYCPLLYSYRIQANGLNGTALFSMSDTSIAKPDNRYEKQEVLIVRSTVVSNRTVLTEWKTPTIEPQMIVSYNIYRSVDNASFKLIENVPAGVNSFIDENVDVQKGHYYYHVKALNICQMESENNNYGVSILLQGSTDKEDNTNIHWTSYDGWPTKPAYYIIEKMNEHGEWETIEKVSGTITEYKDTK